MKNDFTYQSYVVTNDGDSIHLLNGKWKILSQEICLYDFFIYDKKTHSVNGRYCSGFQYNSPVFGSNYLYRDFDIYFRKK